MSNNNFEANMRRLEEIVSILESGECTLEESMKLFEEGAGLLRECTARLDEAEQKVSILTAGEDGNPVRSPFGEEN